MTAETTERRPGSFAVYKELHGQASPDLLERVRVQNHVKAAVRRALADGPATAPEVAEAAGISTREAFWTLMALRKYGVVVDVAEDGGYVRYGLTRKDPRA